MTNIRVTCVIPTSLNTRAKNNIHKCIHSLLSSAKARVHLSIVVVTHGDATAFSQKYPFITFVHTEINCFSVMNNLGINITLDQPSDYYLLINDDAWVEKNFMSVLVRKHKSGSFDMLAPLVYRANGKDIDSFGSEYFTSGHAKNALDLDIHTELATAACVIIKTNCIKRMIKKYGFFFNPIYHYYFEDVELSIRIRAIGGKILKSKSMIAYHLGSQTAKFKSKFVLHHTYRNALWVIFITWPVKYIVRNILSIILIHMWNMFYGCLLYGPFFPFPIVWETIVHTGELISLRQQIISKYMSSFDFSSIFSKYAYRTRSGKTITL